MVVVRLPGKARKYRNKLTTIDGVRFDSQKEAARWRDLTYLSKAGEITDLERQVRYMLNVGGQLICTYVADFRYRRKDAAVIVEDVKSPATRKDPVYRIKKKLMRAIFGIDITEV